MEVVLTGIKPTGQPGTLHIGNYVGAMKPAVAASRNPNVQSYYFLADYHAIGADAARGALHAGDRGELARRRAGSEQSDALSPERHSRDPRADLDPAQRDGKGLMNRAHAYKAAVAENEATPGRDPDQAITMTLYSYPVLMAADILMFKASKVPVGRDQKQHVEMARDIAQRFNHHFGETFVLPDAVIGDNIATLPGLDGRKMSKSYGNAIPLFAREKELRKLVMKIKTNSLEPGQPKDTNDSALYEIYRAFATRRGSRRHSQALRRRYRLGRDEAALVRTHQRGDRARARGVRAADREPARGREAAQARRRASESREPAVPRRDSRPGRHPAARALRRGLGAFTTSGGRRAADVRRLLERVRELQHAEVVAIAADDLDADGQAFGREPRGHGDRGRNVAVIQ